ncbi:MAG: hypothetical protein MUC42_11225 [Bryobacter sp.]|nr:hypothetical protein [Bryobacter sp.]
MRHLGWGFSLITFAAQAWPTGAPVERTGAPGELTCFASQCHVGTLLENSASLRLEFSHPGGYRPGMRQRVRLTIDDPQAAGTYGFQISPRLAREPQRGAAGNLEAINRRAEVLCTTGLLREGWYCPTEVESEFLNHTLAGPDNGIEFDWIAPAQASGAVDFYVAANSGGRRVGARIHLRRFRLEPQEESAERPQLRAAGHAAAFTALLAPETWASVFGTNLAGARASVNNRTATVAYSAAGQVNLLIPANAPPGDGWLEVETPAGRSPRLPLRFQAAAPGWFTERRGGRDFVLAVRPEGTLAGLQQVNVLVPALPAGPARVVSAPAAQEAWLEIAPR